MLDAYLVGMRFEDCDEERMEGEVGENDVSFQISGEGEINLLWR